MLHWTRQLDWMSDGNYRIHGRCGAFHAIWVIIDFPTSANPLVVLGGCLSNAYYVLWSSIRRLLMNQVVQTGWNRDWRGWNENWDWLDLLEWKLDNQSTPLEHFFSGSSFARSDRVPLIGFVYQFMTCELGREKQLCHSHGGTFKLCLSHCKTRVVTAYAEMKKWTSASTKPVKFLQRPL